MNGFEKAIVDVGKVVAWPFEHGAQLIKTVEDGLKDEPAVKTAVVGLISEVGAVTADGAIVVAGKGLDIAADAAELVAMKALFTYVTGTFLPAVKAAYTDLAPDIEALTADATPAPAAPTGATTGPGLHTVVPA